MNAPLRIAAYAAILVAVFATALAAGRWLGPAAGEPVTHADGGHETGDGDDRDNEPAPAAAITGHETSASGYTLDLTDPVTTAGRQRVGFTITGPDGSQVTDYDEQHERDLHLIAVRRDLTGYQHVHPTRDPAAGEWATPLDLTAGTWRVLADFTPAGGDPLVLGTDLQVGGRSTPVPLGEDVRVAAVDDYQVVLNGDLTRGESELTLQVSRRGTPLTDLQPYLGAYGHLVALRAGDLGYLHVHPDGELGTTPAGPDVSFHTAFPSGGRYRLFLDFRHGDVVRTAGFTVTVGDDGDDTKDEHGEEGESGHDH